MITTPPSKYDAAGNAGIINIRLKSRPKDYVGGTASASYSAGEKDNYGYGGVSLNLSKGRVSSFLNGVLRRATMRRVRRITAIFRRTPGTAVPTTPIT